MIKERYTTEDPAVIETLETLIDQGTSPANYRKCFIRLGEKLGNEIKNKIPSDSRIAIACANEDADFLVSGILDNVKVDSISVFWHNRIHFQDFDVAPITSSYIEQIEKCDYLIVAKSIISSSCIVKTQLNCLIEKLNPTNIFIASPVKYSEAEKNLEKEFPKNIFQKFIFFSFATDNKLKEGTNIVIPGIGGDIAKRLDYENYIKENGVIPQLILSRTNQEKRETL